MSVLQYGNAAPAFHGMSAPSALRAFRKQSAMAIHLRVHSEARPFSCSHCTEKFRTLSSLRRHVLSIHERKKPYIHTLVAFVTKDSHNHTIFAASRPHAYILIQVKSRSYAPFVACDFRTRVRLKGICRRILQTEIYQAPFERRI